ncbi:MAG: response regulator [Bacteroidales bacterium]|jgi:DNA-binding response OmpR family regulator|nr:response regulator [Bacteroidales bacterium]
MPQIKALICEDNKLTQRLLEVLLQKMNFEVHVAVDGEQAINYLKIEKIGLLITDINLPYNNGLEIIEYLRKSNEEKIPVIIISNINLEEAKLHAKELGADNYITKPFDPKELMKIIKGMNIL